MDFTCLRKCPQAKYRNSLDKFIDLGKTQKFNGQTYKLCNLGKIQKIQWAIS